MDQISTLHSTRLWLRTSLLWNSQQWCQYRAICRIILYLCVSYTVPFISVPLGGYVWTFMYNQYHKYCTSEVRVITYIPVPTIKYFKYHTISQCQIGTVRLPYIWRLTLFRWSDLSKQADQLSNLMNKRWLRNVKYGTGIPAIVQWGQPVSYLSDSIPRR